MSESDIDSNMSELLLRLAGNATIRATILSHGEHAFSVYDFMDLACPTQSDSWKKMKWKSLIAENSEFKDEIKFTKEYLKYQDQDVTSSNIKKRRLRKTPVMTLQGLQRLLVILGGKVAAEFRTIVLGVFTRYMAGDRSMIEEIHANAVSTAPIHQAYRQALAQEPVLDAAGTKRQLELGHITVYVIFSHECRLYIFFVLLKLTPSKFKDLIFLPDGQFPLLDLQH